jgi:predicted TIM-barrel fold metal-dependent hydrolase
MNIDIYTHFLPRSYARLIKETTSRVNADIVSVESLEKMFPNLCELDTRLRHMDKHDTRIQVLTPLPVPVEDFLSDSDRQTPQELARVANDSLAETIARRPDRFVGVALLPFCDTRSAVEEMERAVKQLGLKGAMIFTNIHGRPLDLAEFFPIYEKAIQLGVPLWMHPVSWNYFPWVRDYLLWQIFCWPFETTLAMARLVYGGVMERYSSLKWITHHSGGTVPFLVGRVSDIYDQEQEFAALYGYHGEARQEQNSETSRRPEDQFRMFYSDVALSGWQPSFICAYQFFGADRLVFGSDYPFGPEQGERFLRGNLAAVEKLEMSAAERIQVLEKNALALLGPVV